jgi:hypothetical protein
MDRRSFFTAAAAAFAIAGLQLSHSLRAQNKWQVFESKEGRFKASFPGTPDTKRGRFRTEMGDVYSARHTVNDALATYDVRYNDYPASTSAKLTPEKMLDALRDGLVAESRGELVWDKPYRLGKYAGRDQEIKGGDGTRYRVRLLLVERRLYQLTAMAQPPAGLDEDRFFGSFQLTGPSKP